MTVTRSELEKTRYTLRAGRSQFLVQVFASGLFSFMGHNPTLAIRRFGGDVQFHPDTLDQASLLVLVQTDSLEVISKASSKDRAEIELTVREEVLEVAKFPEAVYQSTTVSLSPISQGSYRVHVQGKLSLHGVTRECSLDADVAINGEELRARGAFSLRLSDFNIKKISAAAGTLTVKDEVKLTVDILAQK